MDGTQLVSSVVRVGVIGLGFAGETHLKAYQQLPHVRLTVHSSAEDDFGVILYGTEGGAEIKVKNYNWQETLTIFTDMFGVPTEIRPQLPQGQGHKGSA